MLKLKIEEIKPFLKAGSFENLLSTIIRFGARSLWALVLPIYMSIPNYNSYALYYTIIQVILAISILGSTSSIMREKLTRKELIIYISHSVLLTIISLKIESLIGIQFPTEVYLIGSVYLIFAIIYQCETAFIKSRRLFKNVLYAEISSFLTFFIFFFIIKDKLNILFDYKIVFISEIFWYLVLIMILTTLILVRKEINIKFNLQQFFQKFKGIYSIGFLVVIDIIIWRRLEIFFLASSPDASFGPAIINLTLLVAGVIVMIPGSILEAWYPEISQVYLETSKDELLILLKRKIKKFFIFYLVLSTLTLSGFIIYFVFFLTQYHKWAIQIFSFIVIRVIFGFAAYFSNVIYAIRKERTLTIGIFFCAILSVVLHWILTIHYGINGCLIAFFITQVSVFLVTIYIYNLYIPIKSMVFSNVSFNFNMHKK